MGRHIVASSKRLYIRLLIFLLSRGKMENQLFSLLEDSLRSEVRGTIIIPQVEVFPFIVNMNNLLVVLSPFTKLSPNIGKHEKVFP